MDKNKGKDLDVILPISEVDLEVVVSTRKILESITRQNEMIVKCVCFPIMMIVKTEKSEDKKGETNEDRQKETS